MPNPYDSVSVKFVKYTDQQQQPQVFLPDDLLLCIIRRLDVRDVARCRCVCKTWKDLMTSNPRFMDSLLMPVSNFPMIFAQTETGEVWIDEWWQTEILIHEVVRSSRSYSGDRFDQRSQNGFILNRINHYQYIVANPMTGKQVIIFLHKESDDRRKSDIFGVFRRDQHYCTLWRVLMENNNQTQYKMLALESEQPTCWRNIGPLWDHSWVPDTSVVCSDGFMYWMVNRQVNPFGPLIIAFDMKTEDFTEISLPSTYIHCQLIHPSNILNADGSLSLVQVNVDDVITVQKWTLKDHKTSLWTISQYVLFLVKRHPKLWKIQPGRRGMLYRCPRALAIVNSKLIMEGKVGDDESNPSTRGLFVCDLKDGTLKMLRVKEPWEFSVHHPTIASLINRNAYTGSGLVLHIIHD